MEAVSNELNVHLPKSKCGAEVKEIVPEYKHDPFGSKRLAKST